ncbi:MAG: helix-turn-helix domain-containing protein [Bacteroidota bacterium]
MYQLIQQHTKIDLNALPKASNLINFSMLNSISAPVTFRSFSIKYTLQGSERYLVNGRKYAVNDGEYLLANSLCEGRVEIDSPETVKGICIDVSDELLSEVFAHALRSDCAFPDLTLDTFFTGESFLENKYHASGTALGQLLAEIGRLFNQNPFYAYEFTKEYYYTLAEKIVEDHISLIGSLYAIKTVKHDTRKELYRKLCKGKDFLEQELPGNISIPLAARHAGLSEYHFFRLFKMAFGCTPQQYLIRLRLSASFELLRSGNYSVGEAALAAGFTDIFSFSKSFRKHYGHPPSKIEK